MKIALYIEDGLEQIVLTPESETEKGIIGKLHDQTRALNVYRGTFYACRGGWTRQRELGEFHWGPYSVNNDDSTIIVLRPMPPAAPVQEAELPETGPASGC